MLTIASLFVQGEPDSALSVRQQYKVLTTHARGADGALKALASNQDNLNDLLDFAANGIVESNRRLDEQAAEFEAFETTTKENIESL